MQRSAVHTPSASECCVLEKDNYSTLLRSTQLLNVYQMGQPREGCLFSVMSSPEEIALKTSTNFFIDKSKRCRIRYNNGNKDIWMFNFQKSENSTTSSNLL